MKCIICKEEMYFRWTDTHGIGNCFNCGMPYIIYHYDDNKKRVEKDPESAVTKEGIEMAKRYWKETKKKVFPAAFDIGIMPNHTTTFSGASATDVKEWNNFWDTVTLEQENNNV